MNEEPVNEDIAGQVLRDYAAVRRGGGDPELAAVSAAIMLEDVFGIVLADAEIDPLVLGDPAAVAALLARRREVR